MFFNVTVSHPSPCDKPPEHGRVVWKNTGTKKLWVSLKSEWNSIIYICTKALHSLFFAHWRAASIVIPLLPKVTYTPSIQPNIGPSRNRPPLTSAINTVQAIRYSSILSTCLNLLNTLGSAVLASSLSITVLPRIWSFLTLSILDTTPSKTTQTLYLKNNHFPSLSTSHIPCFCFV